MSDPTALRALLEHQVAQLAPISARLHAVAAHPPIPPTDWRGPAADAYTLLESQLRSRVSHGDRAVEQALRDTRAALGQLHG